MTEYRQLVMNFMIKCTFLMCWSSTVLCTFDRSASQVISMPNVPMNYDFDGFDTASILPAPPHNNRPNYKKCPWYRKKQEQVFSMKEQQIYPSYYHYGNSFSGGYPDDIFFNNNFLSPIFPGDISGFNINDNHFFSPSHKINEMQSGQISTQIQSPPTLYPSYPHWPKPPHNGQNQQGCQKNKKKGKDCKDKDDKNGDSGAPNINIKVNAEADNRNTINTDIRNNPSLNVNQNQSPYYYSPHTKYNFYDNYPPYNPYQQPYQQRYPYTPYDRYGDIYNYPQPPQTIYQSQYNIPGNYEHILGSVQDENDDESVDSNKDQIVGDPKPEPPLSQEKNLNEGPITSPILPTKAEQ